MSNTFLSFFNHFLVFWKIPWKDQITWSLLIDPEEKQKSPELFRLILWKVKNHLTCYNTLREVLTCLTGRCYCLLCAFLLIFVSLSVVCLTVVCAMEWTTFWCAFCASMPPESRVICVCFYIWLLAWCTSVRHFRSLTKGCKSRPCWAVLTVSNYVTATVVRYRKTCRALPSHTLPDVTHLTRYWQYKQRHRTPHWHLASETWELAAFRGSRLREVEGGNRERLLLSAMELLG